MQEPRPEDVLDHYLTEPYLVDDVIEWGTHTSARLAERAIRGAKNLQKVIRGLLQRNYTPTIKYVVNTGGVYIDEIRHPETRRELNAIEKTNVIRDMMALSA